MLKSLIYNVPTGLLLIGVTLFSTIIASLQDCPVRHNILVKRKIVFY